ncbi:very short patch repair endonuclease [Nocardioides sp. NBC_00368]|uniref:very short patch repair endonuclease n=1 Tax=Nocardioides sp. NBC_00368 TaxID=2976000 RepID=UPI002E210F07
MTRASPRSRSPEHVSDERYRQSPLPMASAHPDPPVTPATLRTMRANRSRDTSPELALRRLLHASGLRFRVDMPLPIDRRRRADLVFTKVGLYVFVDGCFWHGCPVHFVRPKTRTDFWMSKIEGNQGRDNDTNRRLRELGHTVIRVWEHEDPVDAAELIARMYRALRDKR